MRRISIYFLFVALQFAVIAQNLTDKSIVSFEDTTEYTLEGVWELKSFYYYQKNEIVDTSSIWENYRQIKFFQDGYVMWTRKVPTDTVEWYGFGVYEIKGDTLLERLNYGSHELMQRFIPIHYFKIEIGKNYYRQINFNRQGALVSSENYIRLPPKHIPFIGMKKNSASDQPRKKP